MLILGQIQYENHSWSFFMTNIDQNIRKVGDGQKPSLVFMRSQLNF